MKVWISLCLVWLMVRVVSAGELAQQEHGPYDFSKIQQALNKIQLVSISDDQREHQRVFGLLKTFSSLEELMRGSLTLSWGSPLGRLGWSLPPTQISLGPKDESVFKALAIRYLYPEVRLVEALSEGLMQRVQKHGFVISRQQRVVAQNECLIQSDYTLDCVLNLSLKPVAAQLSEMVSQELGSTLPPQQLATELKSLIEQGGAQSALYVDAFVTSQSQQFLKSISTHELMMACLDGSESFFAWQIIGKRFCGTLFDERVFSNRESSVNKITIDPEVAQVVKDDLFNPFSELQILMVSLSEEVLNRGVLCRTASCKQRKVFGRLQEWTYKGRFTTKQKRDLAKAITKNWLE